VLLSLAAGTVQRMAQDAVHYAQQSEQFISFIGLLINKDVLCH
jgi:redox-regulated HSP33 family molecular chaperone